MRKIYNLFRFVRPRPYLFRAAFVKGKAIFLITRLLYLPNQFPFATHDTPLKSRHFPLTNFWKYRVSANLNRFDSRTICTERFSSIKFWPFFFNYFSRKKSTRLMGALRGNLFSTEYFKINYSSGLYIDCLTLIYSFFIRRCIFLKDRPFTFIFIFFICLKLNMSFFYILIIFFE